ncbi:MAG: hypothetical protein ACTSO7_11415 [Candidatus Heimdallarchaeota archaeon]
MTDKQANKKYFATSMVFLVLSQAISLLIRFASRVIIARYSNPDIYGMFSVIWNEMTFISTIALIGLGQQLTINLPREDTEKKRISILSSISYALIIGFISGMISLILFLVNNTNSYKYSLLISALFIAFMLIQFVLIGLKDFFGYFLLAVVQSSSMLILIAILRNILTIDIMIYITFGSIGLAVLCALVYLLIKYKPLKEKITLKELKLFSFSRNRIYLFIVDIINSTIFYLLLKLPQVMVNNELAAYINVAFSIIAFLLITPQIVGTIFGPVISKDFIEQKYDEIQDSFRISASLIFLIQGILIIGFAFFGNSLIELLFGSEYIQGAYLIFYGFILSAIIDSFNYLYAFYIRNTNREKLFAIGKIISLVLFVGLEALLLHFLTDYVSLAVPVAYFVSIVSLLVFYFFFTLKYNTKMNNKDVRDLLLWFVFMFVSLIAAMIIKIFIVEIGYTILIATAFIVLFLAFIILTKTINVNSLFKEIKAIISMYRNKSNNSVE